MKRALLIGLFFLITTIALCFSAKAEAVVRVKSYFKKSGTYVQSYYRSNNDRYKSNNYSTKGNINPYTGKKGYTRG